MGEIITRILRVGVACFWIVSLSISIYITAGELAAAQVRANWIQDYQSSKRIGNEQAARAALARLKSWPESKLEWVAIERPGVILKVVQADFRRIFEGDFTLPKIDWTLALPLSIAFISCLLMEFVGYPLARQWTAKRLATPENTSNFKKPSSLPRGDGFVLADNVRLDRSTSRRHVLTIGPSGSSKSASLVHPSLLQLPDDHAAVVTDPKSELFCRCSEWLKSRGHPVYLLHPGAGRGVGWDPLRECRTADECRDVAVSILQASSASTGQSSSEWESMSAPLLSSYLIESWSRGFGLPEAIRALFAGSEGMKQIKDPEALNDLVLFESMGGADRTTGSVYATIQKTVSMWKRADLAGFLSHPDRLNLSQIREKKAVVFLCSSADESQRFSQMQHVFYQRLFAVFSSQAQAAPAWILLDEMANLGRLEGLPESLNILRGAGVSVHGFIQQPSQLPAVYGQAESAVVLHSFGTLSVLPGLRDAKEIALLLGRQGDVKDSISTMDERMRTQYSEQQEDTLPMDRVRQMKNQETLIISTNRPPVIARTRPWFYTTALRKRVPAEFRPDWDKIDPVEVQQRLDQAGMIQPRTLKIRKIEKKQVEKKPKRKKHIRLADDDITSSISAQLAGAQLASSAPAEESPEAEGDEQ